MNHVVFLAALIGLSSFVAGDSFGQISSGGFGQSPFERDFGDVKFLDAYFGTINEKIEIEAGDKNVPFTIVFANVGSQDITGIQGQLLLPLGFTSSDGPGTLIMADSNSNSLAGDNFYLTFFVSIADNIPVQQYSGTVKVDYSRLRESGIRTSFTDFKFKVTGDSIINIRASDPFLTSLQTNDVTIEISNDGTAPISGVDILATNTQTELATTSSSITNVENVVLLESNWDIGTIEPESSKFFTTTVYVPESLKGDTLRIPLAITYYNAHGDQETISKIVDFYIRGLIDLSIFDVNVIVLSDKHAVVGEILNEGNQDGLFGFASVQPRGDSNIKPQTQFIDEIEIDAPVPFNLPLEFDGTPRYGEHEVTITIRYKDSLRDEHFFDHDTMIHIEEIPAEDQDDLNIGVILIPMAVIGAFFFLMRMRKKRSAMPETF